MGFTKSYLLELFNSIKKMIKENQDLNLTLYKSKFIRQEYNTNYFECHYLSGNLFNKILQLLWLKTKFIRIECVTNFNIPGFTFTSKVNNRNLLNSPKIANEKESEDFFKEYFKNKNKKDGNNDD